jgi:hypothetical protein
MAVPKVVPGPPGVKVRIRPVPHPDHPIRSWEWRCDWHPGTPFTALGDSPATLTDWWVEHLRRFHACPCCHRIPDDLPDARPRRWWEWL